MFYFNITLVVGGISPRCGQAITPRGVDPNLLGVFFLLLVLLSSFLLPFLFFSFFMVSLGPFFIARFAMAGSRLENKTLFSLCMEGR